MNRPVRISVIETISGGGQALHEKFIHFFFRQMNLYHYTVQSMDLHEERRHWCVIQCVSRFYLRIICGENWSRDYCILLYMNVVYV